MEYADFISSGIGAVLGFTLAQLVGLARLCWEGWTKPKLGIEQVGDNSVVLSHGAEVRQGEFYDEDVFGFYVRNSGRRIAAGVRFQLIQIKIRDEDWSEFKTITEQAYDLTLYHGADRMSEDRETVLVPGAAALVKLAGWREDYDAIFPAVNGLPDYYEEICSRAIEYQFVVVAFDNKARFDRKVLTIKCG